LENDSAIGPWTDKLLAGQDDPALGNVVQAGHHREHSGFAASGVADKANELALLYPEIEIPHDNRRTF
jgi:hypothetical protein